MSIDLDLDFIDGASSYTGKPTSPLRAFSSNVHEAIFYQPNSSFHFIKNTTVMRDFSPTDEKIEEVSVSRKVKPYASAEAEASVDITWGRKEGVTVSGSASGKIQDDKGNYAKVKVSQDSDGNGKANVSAGHKKGKDE